MAPVTTSIDIERPAAVVYAYVTDPTRFPEWQKGVTAGQMEGAEAPRVGDRCRTVRRIGLANRSVTAEVHHVDPPRSWGVRGVDGPVRAAVDVTVEALDAGRSRLTIAIAFTGYGIGRLLVPLVVRPEAAKEMPHNVARLKRRLEAA